MNKNILVIGAIIILVAAIAFVYVKDNERKCEWQPAIKYACLENIIDIRYYYALGTEGYQCFSLVRCSPGEEPPPFKTVEECVAACM